MAKGNGHAGRDANVASEKAEKAAQQSKAARDAAEKSAKNESKN